MKELTGSSNALRNISREREKKVTKGTIIITMVFIACLVTFFVFQLLEIFCVMCWIKFPEVLTVFGMVALLLVLINSVVNSYINAYRLPKYLQAFKYLWKEITLSKIKCESWRVTKQSTGGSRDLNRQAEKNYKRRNKTVITNIASGMSYNSNPPIEE